MIRYEVKNMQSFNIDEKFKNYHFFIVKIIVFFLSIPFFSIICINIFSLCITNTKGFFLNNSKNLIQKSYK